MKRVAPGITIFKRYGRFKNACWLLQSGNEAAVVEMPMFKPTERPPYQRTESFTRRRKLRLKYALLSHGHIDHCYTLPHFRACFPNTQFVGHRSFLTDSHFHSLLRRLPGLPYDQWLAGRYVLFDEVFQGDLWQGDLAGEPLYMIHAPKHSPTDLLIIFRGVMITGDWVVGDLRDCNALVPTEQKKESIQRVRHLVGALGYHVHSMFSAHGDTLMYGVDFQKVMEQSLRVH